MRGILLVLLVTASLVPLGSLVSPGSRGANITVETTMFDNGQPSVTVEFSGGGVDDNYGLSLQTGLLVEEVRMNLSSVAQPAGSRDYPSNIAIDFGGDKAIEWAWKGPGYGPLGRQNLFVNNKPAMNASVPYTGGYNDTVAIRLPKTATVRSATMNVSTGGQLGTAGKLLLLMGEYPWGNYYTDVKNRLGAFSNFTQIDTFDANKNKPTWDDVKDYRYILTWTMGWYGYGYGDQAAVGNIMADYVDAGGSLVTAEGCSDGYSYSPGGRWASQGYQAIPIGNGGYHSYSSHYKGEVPDPSDPVMAGVNSISDYYWTTSQKTPAPGGSVIAYWNDGHLLAARNTMSGVETISLGFYPVSTWYHYAGWDYYTDGARLMANALLNCGRKPVTVAVDMFRDGTEEFNRTNFLGNYTLPDFSATLNSFIAGAPVSYSDPWGNQFVDVPVNVTSPRSGFLSFNNLDIRYDFSTAVDANPAFGNLTNSVADLQSSIVGEENHTIPMYVSSSSSGKLKLSGLYVRMMPPQHSPRVDSFYPALATAVREDSRLELGVNATDIYGNPMTYSWSRDGEPVPGATTNRLSVDYGFEDAGNHTVAARIDNGISAKTFIELTWQIRVLDVNRPPLVASFDPASDVTLDENATQRFGVQASDPDSGDELSYLWSVDGRRMTEATGPDFAYLPSFTDSGTHSVKVVVTDRAGATDSHTWQVTVTEVNLAPLIQSWSPLSDPQISEKESLQFSVAASDPDREDRLTVSWYVDDALVFVGNSFTYSTDYTSAGTHRLKAVASDGEGTDTHSWTVTVLNVNRLPQAAIASPADRSEFQQGEPVRFSGSLSSDPDNETLSYSWKEGGVNVSDQAEFERAFAPGLHTLTLEVRDPSGGRSSATVRFRVRFIEYSTSIGLDRLDVQAGNKVTVVLTMTNLGDINGTEVQVELLVDGKSVGTATVKDFRPGTVEKAQFTWKATKGPHTLTAKVGDQTWTKEVTVAAAPAPPPAAGIADYAWTIVLAIMLVVLLAFGAMVFRKK